jgi:anti-sigma B factor antagonist
MIGRTGGGTGVAVAQAAGPDGQDRQPCSGGGMHSFHLESITAGDDCVVLRIDGDIDAYAAPQLRDRVTGLAGNGTVHIIADLRGAGFIDSAGLGALVGSRKELRARGGSLTLVASSDRILQTLRIAGLSDAFGLHSRVPDAIIADRHWQAAVSGEGDNAGEWCRKHGLL